MATTRKSPAQVSAEEALAQARRAVQIAELALLRAKLEPQDPQEPPVSTLLKLRIKYRDGEKEYTYTALRTDNGWLISGRRYEGQLWSWEDVLHLADKNAGQRAELEIQGRAGVLR